MCYIRHTIDMMFDEKDIVQLAAFFELLIKIKHRTKKEKNLANQKLNKAKRHYGIGV